MSALNQELANFVLPQAPIKTLWFEFLLQPSLLERHLSNPDCDPSATDLIVLFMNNASAAVTNAPPPTPIAIPVNPINGNGDDYSNGKKTEPDENRKGFALKMLAIKTLSFIKWDLEFIETKLSLATQFTLVNEFIKLCESETSRCRLFSYITYYRWLIRTAMKVSYPSRPPKGNVLSTPLMQQIDPLFVPHDIMDSIIKKVNGLVDTAADGLEKVLLDSTVSTQFLISRPLIDCFGLKLGPDGNLCDWTKTENVNVGELLDELKYELGKWFFLREDYQKANSHFEAVTMMKRDHFDHFDGFLSSTRSMLEMSAMSEPETDVMQYFEDGLKRISQGGCCDLTTVERRLDPPAMAAAIEKFYSASSRTESEKLLLRKFAQYLSFKIVELKDHISFLKSALVDTKKTKGSNKALELEEDKEGELMEDSSKEIEHILLESTDPEVILTLCTKIDKHPQSINRSWEIPKAHMTCMQHAHPGIYRKCHIVLAKAAELRKALMFIESRTLYRSLLEDVQASLPDLAQLIIAEILRTDLEYYFRTNDVDERIVELLEKCHCILIKAKFVMDLTPELIEQCCVFMLNFVTFASSGHAANKDLNNRMREYVASPNPMVRLTGLLFCAASDGNLTSKTSKPLFDEITSALTETSRGHPKRSKHHHTPPRLTPAVLTNFVTKLKISQGSALSEAPHQNSPVELFASALIKVFNLVRDSSKIQNIDLTLFSLRTPTSWPKVVTRDNSSVTINISTVSLCLHALLDKLLEQKPMDLNWIRTKAELALIEENHKESLKHFVTLLVITTEYFSAFSRSEDEEATIKRMIEASTNLNYHTEAAVLHQMVTKPSYDKAFKALSERTCYDSCEDLYECIWDTNMLEFLVSLHARRGELDRKTKTMHLIGQLELNANNSPEILREAANIRKAKFFEYWPKSISKLFHLHYVHSNMSIF
ncbi:Integrator complex subunit 8 [Halotydeus destructor]|nr:Integrator complex subunit 8 [Halotydeus destructor]